MNGQDEEDSLDIDDSFGVATFAVTILVALYNFIICWFFLQVKLAFGFTMLEFALVILFMVPGITKGLCDLYCPNATMTRFSEWWFAYSAG